MVSGSTACGVMSPEARLGTSEGHEQRFSAGVLQSTSEERWELSTEFVEAEVGLKSSDSFIHFH